MKTKEAYSNLIELWSNNEELMFLLSNKVGEISREGAIKYATPISMKIGNAINDGKFEDYDDLDREQFIEKVKKEQEHYNKEKEGRRTSINFLNAHISDKPIGFRMAGVRNIAEKNGYAEVKNAESELVQRFLGLMQNVLECDNSTPIIDDSVSLDN